MLIAETVREWLQWNEIKEIEQVKLEDIIILSYHTKSKELSQTVGVKKPIIITEPITARKIPPTQDIVTQPTFIPPIARTKTAYYKQIAISTPFKKLNKHSDPIIQAKNVSSFKQS